MRTGKARTGLSAGLACHRRWNAYGNLLAVWTRGGSRMRESRTYGSGRGARGNSRPYREGCGLLQMRYVTSLSLHRLRCPVPLGRRVMTHIEIAFANERAIIA